MGAAKSSSGVRSSILIFVVIGAAFYFLIYRPQQKKQKAARAQSNEFDVGDEVVTAGGIVGRVLDITDDRVTLETSVGASFVVLRPYVLRKLEPAEPPTDVVDGESDEATTDHEPEPPSGATAPRAGARPRRTSPPDGPPTTHEAAPTTPPPDDERRHRQPRARRPPDRLSRCETNDPSGSACWPSSPSPWCR